MILRGVAGPPGLAGQGVGGCGTGFSMDIHAKKD